jgi:hypothetical protein
MDAIEEQMHHNIENGQAIVNTVVARILDPVSLSSFKKKFRFRTLHLHV